MPRCGSQVVLCDVPVRFDTYEGCGHACSYCFVLRKTDIAQIKLGETPAALRKWIEGQRGKETDWCDWDIPLHWGGMSDPFQPAERLHHRSLEALEVFAETQYPFIVSTKSALIAEEPYLSLIKKCNCVVQFSVASPQYDKIERGAATYEKRLEAAAKIAPYKRVVFRIQPYIPGIFRDVIKGLRRFAEIGVYGVILEGMKYTKPVISGLYRSGNDFVYPVTTLLPQFKSIKAACHKYGLKFYCGENRLRALGDDLCCCGVDGLGWRVNTANLNHSLFAPETFGYTDKMQKIGTAYVFKCLEQNALSGKEIPLNSFASKMEQYKAHPYPYAEGLPAFNPQQEKTLRAYLRHHLKAAGVTIVQVNKHIGTSGMASHYFSASQWAFPTLPNYDKMREIIPTLQPYEAVLASVGIKAGRGYKIYYAE